MTPADLGLPLHFVKFRKGQLDTAIAVAGSDKRFNLLSSPTGSGKSLTVNAISRLLDARTLILTATKGLQQQYMHDFASIGMVDIRGQNNYRCVALDRGGVFEGWGTPGSGCDEGPCHVGEQCQLRDKGCLYYDAVRKAAASKLVVTNNAYWMTTNRFSDPDSIGKFDLLVIDEAHSIPDTLAEFCSVKLDRSEIRALIDMDLPPVDDQQETWIDWAQIALDVARRNWVDAQAEYKQIGTDRRKMGKKLRRLVDLGRGLKELAAAHKWRNTDPASPDVWVPGMNTDWVAERTETGASFSPVWAHAYAEAYLFKAIPHVLMVSATLQKAVARYLGIDPSKYVYSEHVSTFDPARRPVMYVPTTNVDRNMTEGQIRIWVNKIDKIVDGRLDRKGIIHTRSYDRARVLVERSRHRGLFITHGSSYGRGTMSTKDAVNAFKQSKAPRILVSPSMEEGYDFPYDECRYQIIAKVPFIDTRSPLMKARHKSDKTYVNYLTALSIIQQTGRGMRAEDDLCETFLVDDHISWFWHAANKQKLFPNWYKQAFKQVIGVPAAPRLK